MRIAALSTGSLVGGLFARVADIKNMRSHLLDLTAGARHAAAGFAIVVAIASGAAPAAAVPAAGFYYDATIPGSPAESCYATSPCNLAAGGAWVQESGTPQPSVTATASSSSAAVAPTIVDTEIAYYFELSGPTATIPVTVSGSLSTFLVAFSGGASQPGGYAQPIVVLAGDHQFLLEEEAYCTFSNGVPTAYGPNGYCGQKSFSDHLLLAANTQYQVFLVARADALAAYSQTASDPTISVDASFGDTSAYIMKISSGIGDPGFPDVVADSTPIAEPASVTLLAVGVLGLASRRRRTFAPREEGLATPW